MEKRKSPKGFIVVLPGEIIELRSAPLPYEVLRTDKYYHIVCDDMFKLPVG